MSSSRIAQQSTAARQSKVAGRQRPIRRQMAPDLSTVGITALATATARMPAIWDGSSNANSNSCSAKKSPSVRSPSKPCKWQRFGVSSPALGVRWPFQRRRCPRKQSNASSTTSTTSSTSTVHQPCHSACPSSASSRKTCDASRWLAFANTCWRCRRTA